MMLPTSMWLPKRIWRALRRYVFVGIFVSALALWQIVVVCMAMGAALANVGSFRHDVAPADREFVQSLWTPSSMQLTSSIAEMTELRQSFDSTSTLYQQTVRSVLDGADPMVAARKLKELSSTWSISNQAFHSHISDSEHQISKIAHQAVCRGMFDEPFVPLLRELPYLKGHYLRSFISGAAFGEALICIKQGRFMEACDLLQDDRGHDKNEVVLAQESLGRLEHDPSDFQARLNLYKSLHTLEMAGGYSTAILHFYWPLYDDAKTPSERAQVLLEIAPFYRYDPSGSGPSTRRAIYAAACRLLSGKSSAEAQAKIIAAMADLEHERKNDLLALALYQAISDAPAPLREWGRSTFNCGYLLRGLGDTRSAIAYQRRLLGSGVNDLDPGGHIMETYINYRHNAASEIALARRVQWNFPSEYVWIHRAEFRYPYRSWCGTCQDSEEREMNRALRTASFRAGPVFFLWNCAHRPDRYAGFALYVMLAAGIVQLLFGKNLGHRVRATPSQAAKAHSGGAADE